MKSVEIVNIIGTLDFNRELELSAVADLLRSSNQVNNVEYTPGRIHWLQSYFNSPQKDTERYVAFYRSGSCAIVGCKSTSELETVARVIKEVMEPVITDSTPQTEIKNIVVSGDIGTRLNLEQIAVVAGLENIEYEPEQFPGLIYRLLGDTVLVFSSGKVVITGAKNITDAQETFDKLIQELQLWGVIN